MIRLRWISSRSNWIAAAALADATSGASTRNALRGPRAATKLERGTMTGRGEPANRCLGGYGVHRPRRRYAAGDGGQINKLWERRVAAAAP